MNAIVPGELVELGGAVRRITAPNPGMMTGPGTNTYLVGEGEVAVIDPGPDIDSHRDAILAAADRRIRWILCTHTHLDHSPLAAALHAATGAPVFGRVAAQDGRQDAGFSPQRVLEHNATIDCGAFRLRAVHTPGHASNHLCYLLEGERLIFTGDHVMQGSTVVISPPDGDMAAYFRSLELLLALDIDRIAPGHGHVIPAPHEEVKRIIAHRLKRERKVLDAFSRKNPATLDELVPLVYDDVSPKLYPAARRSLHAHLIKLAAEARVMQDGESWGASGA